MMSEIITWNKKHSSKQSVPLRYSLAKKYVAAATFKG